MFSVNLMRFCGNLWGKARQQQQLQRLSRHFSQSLVSRTKKLASLFFLLRSIRHETTSPCPICLASKSQPMMKEAQRKPYGPNLLLPLDVNKNLIKIIFSFSLRRRCETQLHSMSLSMESEHQPEDHKNVEWKREEDDEERWKTLSVSVSD